MKAEPIEAWYCAECGLPHWEFEEAVECCQWPPTKKGAYACERCREVYTTEKEAAECCGEGEA